MAVAPFHDDSIMSYLIAMYVFYHGNNLAAFGFVKGSKEIDNQNEGLDVPYESLRGSGIVPDSMLDVEMKREQVKKENDYEAIMREAMVRAQQESIALSSRGLVRNELLDNTPVGVLDDMYSGEIDLNFFDELNQF